MRTPAYSSFGMAGGYRFSDKRYRLRFDHRFEEMTACLDAAVLNAAPWYQVYYPGKEFTRRSGIMKGGSPLELSAKNVEIVAVKKAENREALIIRLLEHAGKATDCSVKLAGAAKQGSVAFGPFQLKTIEVSRKGIFLIFQEVSSVEDL